jgi:hypothetical protein
MQQSTRKRRNPVLPRPLPMLHQTLLQRILNLLRRPRLHNRPLNHRYRRARSVLQRRQLGAVVDLHLEVVAHGLAVLGRPGALVVEPEVLDVFVNGRAGDAAFEIGV